VYAGTHPHSAGQVFNVHDDELLTASAYLRKYKKFVKHISSVRLPYYLTWILAWLLERYHCRSLGQLPPILTRYKVAAQWGGNRFDNEKLHELGWHQRVLTQEGVRRTLESFRCLDEQVR
jgi:nucleoside-diphosphate-sugar epimerase